MPRFHHPDQATPGKIGIFSLGLEDPMQVSFPGFNIVTQVHFHQYVQSKPLSGLLDQRNLELPEYLTPRAITAEQIVRPNEIFSLGQLVSNSTEDFAVFLLFEIDKAGPKSDVPALSRRSLDQDWFKHRLRQIHVMTGTGTFILASSLRVVTPRVDPAILFTGHVVTPTRVDHTVSLHRIVQTRLFQVDIPETLKSCGVCDVGSGCL